MIVRTEDIKSISNIILYAVDTKDTSTVTETLELLVEDGILNFNVTNGEYFVNAKLPLYEDISFHATVNASIFLKLISQVTTETIDFSIIDNCLVLICNGIYKFPLIYDGDKLLELPKIYIDNITSEFDVDSAVLLSILKYNSKQLTIGNVHNPVQKMYYLDENGAITFTSGACVNSFSLDSPIKILLTQKIVRLFKLFNGQCVHFTIGHDAVSDSLLKTKLRFETDSVSITSIMSCDDSLLNSFPAKLIRATADEDYPYSAVINKNDLISAINRFMVFCSDKFSCMCSFVFNDSCLELSNINKSTVESINYINRIESGCSYLAHLDLLELKSAIDCYSDDYVNIFFGNNKSILVSRGSVVNIIPEAQVT